MKKSQLIKIIDALVEKYGKDSYEIIIDLMDEIHTLKVINELLPEILNLEKSTNKLVSASKKYNNDTIISYDSYRAKLNKAISNN